jgi:hypothetical protein
MSGALAGMFLSMFSTPPQVLKVQLQMRSQVLGPPTHSLWRETLVAARETLSHRGLKGFYRGFGAQVLCEGAGRGLYYPAYEFSKRWLVQRRTGSAAVAPMGQVQGATILESCVAAGMAGALAWTCTFPADIARIRMQSYLPGHTRPRYSGVWDCLSTSVREEGWGVLIRGLGVTVLRGIPVAMTVLPTFDLLRNTLRKVFNA